MKAHHYHPNVNERTWSDLKIYYYTKNTIILNKRHQNMATLLNIFFTVGATFYKILLHNGWTGIISYLYRNNLKSLVISIQRGLNGHLEIDFQDKSVPSKNEIAAKLGIIIVLTLLSSVIGYFNDDPMISTIAAVYSPFPIVALIFPSERTF